MARSAFSPLTHRINAGAVGDMGSDARADEDMRNVYALGFVSFFTDVSTEMVLSLLPAFVLGLPGSSRALLGLIEGTAESLSYGLRAVSGVFSDKFRKRKILVLAGYALSTATKPLFSVARTAMDALVIRVTDRVGKGVRTAPRDALISESVSGARRGAAFGLHRTLDQLGAILGPVIASAAIAVVGFTARDVFWLSFFPGVVALLLILFFVREQAAPTSPVAFPLLTGVREVLTGRYVMLLLLVGVFSVGAFNFSFILLHAQERGVATPLIPLVYAVVNVAHTAVALPAGLLADRVGKERVLSMGYGVFLATVLLILLAPPSVASAVLVAIVFGVYMGIVETVQRALIPGYAAPGLRGTAYGLYYLVVGAAFFVANTVVGVLWEHVGSSAVIYCTGTSSIALLGLLLFLRGLERDASG
jgi:MFS family permease